MRLLNFLILISVCLITVSWLSAQDEEPRIIDGALVFPLREASDYYPKLPPKKPPPISTLPDGLKVPTIPAAIAEDFARYILDTVQAYSLPGIAFAIVQANTVTVEKTYGFRSQKEATPIDKQTLFNIGPATQAITSLLAANLSAEFTHLFDEPASKLFPEFRLNDAQSQKNIRLRDLLNMTGGIPDYTDNILDPAWAKPEDIFAVISQSPIIAQPGQIFNYSNVSVSCAGYLLARIHSPESDIYTSFTQSVKQRLLLPMGMTRATFSLDEAKATDNYASPHKQQQEQFKVTARWEPAVNPFAPSIGLKANLEDMQHWLITELQEGIAPNGQRIAPAFAVRERWKPTDVQTKIYSGMGWTHQTYEKTEIIANTGSYDRHTCGIGFMPRYRTGFVVLINTNCPDAAKIVQEMALGLTEILIKL